jgi:hypothetical protein
MSAMGALAQDMIAEVKSGVIGAAAVSPRRAGIGNCADGNQRCTPIGSIPNGTQSEVSIAVDSTGQNIVVAFNDFRGFLRDPISLSGFMYSNDGGQTFIDGGQLPTPGNQTAFGLTFPQVFGDPAVKYLGACNFVYASLMIKVTTQSGLVQTLAVHRSRDCGKSWEGPFEVTPATNPNAQVDVGFNALDAADKELLDVDPDTGRLMIGWANFTPAVPGGVEMSVTYSDNIMSGTPTFAPRRIIASGNTDGQGASVQFAGNGSPNAYIAWTRYTGFYTRRMAFARSTDNGNTWSGPYEIAGTFLAMDEVLGNDRVNEFPSVAVDNSPGPHRGNVYVVYSRNNSLDGADVGFQRSTDGGVTFSPPILLNARPGADRPQWFPFVSVDRTTGRVHVFYYDQGVDTSGHLTQVSYQYSDDGGLTWTRPVGLEKPFKAGWGNDASQPNLGDYNHSVAQFATMYAAYAVTRPQVFTSGQPGVQFNTPDVAFSKVSGATVRASLQLGTVGYSATGGNGSIDPGETVTLTIPLLNGSLNPLISGNESNVTALLSTSTPGVTITQASATYGTIAPGATVANTPGFVLSVSPVFKSGVPIELLLTVTSNSGTTIVAHTLTTGTLLSTTLLSENFEGAATGTLPLGWQSVHGAGANTVPWVGNNTFCGTSNKAFHQNANDGPPSGSPARWERLFSPVIQIPGDANEVEVEFDVCYDTEEDPNFRVLAYDGFFLRATDLTPGRLLRSVLVEAFEQEFTTGPIKHYPKHLPRSNDPAYFSDMSVWAGASGGWRHVRMKLPGMAGSTVQFRFEYTQDAFATCADVRPTSTVCGVAIDNFVVKSVRAVAPPTVNLLVTQSLTRATSGEYVATIDVRNAGSAAANNVRLSSVTLGNAASTTAMPNLGTIAPGATASAVVRFRASAGASGSATVLRVNGLYDGGTITGSVRVTLP